MSQPLSLRLRASGFPSYCCNVPPVPELPERIWITSLVAERSSVYGWLSCSQTCSAFSSLHAMCSTAPSLKRLVSLFSKCVVSPVVLLILHLQRTTSCCDDYGQYRRFSVGGRILALLLCTQSPTSCHGDGWFQLLWG